MNLILMQREGGGRERENYTSKNTFFVFHQRSKLLHGFKKVVIKKERFQRWAGVS